MPIDVAPALAFAHLNQPFRPNNKSMARNARGNVALHINAIAVKPIRIALKGEIHAAFAEVEVGFGGVWIRKRIHWIIGAQRDVLHK